MSYQYPTKAGVDAAEPLDFTEKRITLSTTVQYRGRAITITAEGYTLDQFSDLLDKRAPAPPEAPGRVTEVDVPPPHFTPDGAPTCQNPNCSRYGKPFAPSAHGGLYCTGRDTITGNAKGYCKQTA